MTKEAEIFKSKNKLNYEIPAMKDFNTFPALSGIYEFKTGRHRFNLICVKNDDLQL